jgi:hypothetical protein
MSARDLELIRLCAELSELMIPGSDLPAPNVKLITRGGGATLMPFFFACENGPDLFICIRGASEPADFLLVLDFEREDFAGGKAHRGVLRAARWIIDECRRFIDACTGRIVCCGHSLGGASSGMVAAVLTLEEHRPNVIGICQAPFPILSAELSEQLDASVTSFAFRNDIVPRLTSANVGSLVRMFAPPGPNQQQGIAAISGIVAQIMQGIMMQNPWGGTAIHGNVQEQLPVVVDRLMRTSRETEPHEFVLAGRPYLLGFGPNAEPTVRRYVAEDGVANLAAFIMAIADHSGDIYREILYSLDVLE